MTYELLEQIGAGGMATVHRARLRGIGGFDRTLAVKRIAPSLASDPHYVARFEREARIAMALSHANIVAVHDFDRDDDGYFIAMEHLDGYGLDRILRRAALGDRVPIAVVLSLLVELCDALDHAHTRRGGDGVPLGIVHRDISPANLFVRRSGHLKLLDFGVAAMRGIAIDVVGKPSYMAPETIRGATPDARVDIFAAGIIAWELLTSRPLFRGDDDAATFANVVGQPMFKPSCFRTDCPAALDAIVMHALERSPARRTPSAAAMRDSLEALIEASYPDARPSSVERWLATPDEDRETTLFERVEMTPIAPPVAVVPAPATVPAISPIETVHVARPQVPKLAAIDETMHIPDPTFTPGVRVTPWPASAFSLYATRRSTPALRVSAIAAAIVIAAVGMFARRGESAIDGVSKPSVTVNTPAPAASVATTTTPRYFPPDRVQRISGALSSVDSTRLAPAWISRHGRISALICIDARGEVASARVLTPAPDWLHVQLEHDLRAFRFTAYQAAGVATAGCFARQLPITVK